MRRNAVSLAAFFGGILAFFIGAWVAGLDGALLASISYGVGGIAFGVADFIEDEAEVEP